MILIDFLEMMNRLNLCDKSENYNEEGDLLYSFKTNDGYSAFDQITASLLPKNCKITYYEGDDDSDSKLEFYFGSHKP